MTTWSMGLTKLLTKLFDFLHPKDAKIAHAKIRKEKEKTPSDESMVTRSERRCKHQCTWYTAWRLRVNLKTTRWIDAPSSTSVGWMEELKEQKSVAPDEPTVHCWAASVCPMIHWNKTETTWVRGLKHRMNRQSIMGTVGLSDDPLEQERDDLSQRP
jgi:hypothetical protein